MDIPTAFVDIETNMSLDGTNGIGFMLCASMKMGGEKEIFTTKISDGKGYGTRLKSGKFNLEDDLSVAKDIKKWIAEKDPEFIVGHFGELFDFPYINTRLLGKGQKRMQPVRVLDTWKIAKNTLKLGRNSLESLAEHLGLEEHKMHLSRLIWQRAALGDRHAMRQLTLRCESDVRLLESVFGRILPMTRQIKGQLM